MAISYGGGINQTDFFAVNTAGTACNTVTALTMVPTGTAATLQTQAFLTAVQNYAAGITPTKLGKGRELSLDQDQFSGDLLRAMDVFQAGVAGTTEYYMDGEEAPELTASGDAVNNAIAINYIGVDPSAPTKTLVLIIHGNFKEGSGAFNMKNAEKRKVKVDFVSKKTTAALVIASELFDASIVTVAADVTLASGEHYQLLSLLTT